MTSGNAGSRAVLGRIRAEGALSALDFEPERGAPKDWFAMPESVVRAVREAYTVAGVLGLARREGNFRYYDLLERLLPAKLLGHEVPVREHRQHHQIGSFSTVPGCDCQCTGGRISGCVRTDGFIDSASTGVARFS